MVVYKKINHFILVVATLVTLRLIDLFVTYLYTPLLNQEINPLVSIFGMSWGQFLLSQTVIVIVVCGFSAYYIWGKSHKVEKGDLNYSDFIYYYFYDELEPWRRRFFKMPKHIDRHFRLLSYVVSLIAILVSILAIIHNLLLLVNVDVYIDFINLYFFQFALILTLSLIFLSVNIYFMKEYKLYKNTDMR